MNPSHRKILLEGWAPVEHTNHTRTFLSCTKHKNVLTPDILEAEQMSADGERGLFRANMRALQMFLKTHFADDFLSRAELSSLREDFPQLLSGLSTIKRIDFKGIL